MGFTVWWFIGTLIMIWGNTDTFTGLIFENIFGPIIVWYVFSVKILGLKALLVILDVFYKIILVLAPESSYIDLLLLFLCIIIVSYSLLWLFND